jgi:hypothetical protein
MRRRAMDAGCRTIFAMLDWLDKWYGDRPEREQDNSLPPPGEALSVDHESPATPPTGPVMPVFMPIFHAR